MSMWIWSSFNIHMEFSPLYLHELRGHMQNNTADEVNYGKNGLLIILFMLAK